MDHKIYYNHDHIKKPVIYITGYSLFDKNVSKDKNDHLTILSFMKENNYPKKKRRNSV